MSILSLNKVARIILTYLVVRFESKIFVCLSPGGESLGLDLLEFPTSSGLRDGYMGHVPDIQ